MSYVGVRGEVIVMHSTLYNLPRTSTIEQSIDSRVRVVCEMLGCCPFIYLDLQYWLVGTRFTVFISQIVNLGY